MVIDSERTFMDYGSISTWWDECASLGRVKNERMQLGEDFLVEHSGYNFSVFSHGHMLFRFVKNPLRSKTPVNFYITAIISAEQFEVIYQAFLKQIDNNFDELSVESQYKEMVDEPNSVNLIDSLTKKYTE